MFVGIPCLLRILRTKTSSTINFTRKIHTRALYIAEMVDKTSIVYVCVCLCLWYETTTTTTASASATATRRQGNRQKHRAKPLWDCTKSLSLSCTHTHSRVILMPTKCAKPKSETMSRVKNQKITVIFAWMGKSHTYIHRMNNDGSSSGSDGSVSNVAHSESQMGKLYICSAGKQQRKMNSKSSRWN